MNFNGARHAQEEQLYYAMIRNSFPLVIGDANTCIFKYFHRVDQETHATFPETEEHLDHLLCLPGDAGRVHHVETAYHDDISFSDHIPVVYTITIRRKSSRLTS
jgi:endonuclease/exonuclease/phosphatase family metal-dependent hydrolase